MDGHRNAVTVISATVRQFYNRKEKFRISHGYTNSTRLTKRDNVLDTSGLSHVLEVNVAKQSKEQEAQNELVDSGSDTMDRLVEETLKYWLVPPVVMEFPGITVGGGYAGTSGESSSFKHGFFNTTVNWAEIVLANGEIVKCSKDEKADLFHGAAGAIGSLGVTTLLELQLLKAKQYVETTYHPVASVGEAIETIQEFRANSDLDYVDGILFSESQGVLVTGKMVDQIDRNVRVQCFSGTWDPWFYLHARKVMGKSDGPVVEAVPLAEYLFRYDRGGFGVGVQAFLYFKTPFNDFTRWFLDDFLHTRMMYTALHASRQAKEMIIQDLALPYSTTEEFVDYTAKNLNIWPLWLCPLHQSPCPTFHPYSDRLEASGKTRGILNIGLLGPSTPSS